MAIDLSVASVQIGDREFALRLAGKPPGKRAASRLSQALSALGSGGGNISNPPHANPGVSRNRRTWFNSLHFSGTHTVLERGFKTEWLTVKP